MKYILFFENHVFLTYHFGKTIDDIPVCIKNSYANCNYHYGQKIPKYNSLCVQVQTHTKVSVHPNINNS
jgi:hypothetical protein